MNQLTAAHRTLPFGTRVRVQNLENDASVEVVINDRGPYIEGRTIDLSFAAARALKLDKVGVARVRLELLSAPIPLAVIE
jgi:rare lipoprotein A